MRLNRFLEQKIFDCELNLFAGGFMIPMATLAAVD